VIRYRGRDVHSLRDFLVAVQTGAQVAITMLDDIEAALLRVLRSVNEDSEGESS